MAGKKNPNLGDKLRQEREGAENTLRDSRNKTADSSTGDSNKKKAEHRRQIRHEADLAKMRSKKLKSEQEVKAKKNAAVSGKKGGKPKKPGNLAADALSAKAHQGVRNADQDNNSGVEAAHFTEGSAEGAARAGSRFQYGRKLRQYKKLERLEKKADKDAVDSIFAERMKADPQAGSNLFSRWRQKQDIRQSYYAAARSGTAAQTAGGKAASNGASAARSGVEQAVEKGKTAVSTAVKGLVNAAKGNAHVLVIVGVFLLLVLMVMSGFSSCGILFSGGTQVSGQTIYSAEDRDIWGAEQDYKKLEKELDKKIKRTPTDHPGYNEYQYHLDPIEHDPWQLTSFLTTLYDDYTRSEVQGKLKETFKKQYKLTTWVEVQIRYKTVWVISPAGIPVPTQVPYEYKIFHTKLVNRGLEVVIREELDNDQWKRYEIFQDTLGGRPYLFNGGLPPGGSDGSGTPGIDYQVPAEALTDSEFAAIYKEAQKYVGTPYVWGGSTPETGFDCSGYVCWVYNQNGYDVGRTTANGLWNKSQHISEADAKPGDLVFFKGTYDTPGMSHTGIYLGNGMMVSAGDPIKYANIHSSYWEKHLAGFGRLSK